ncbi:MAG: ilvE [bacterium]|nr:MAG: ilvE [bacterium]
MAACPRGPGLGYETREQVLPREALYVADEIFMTGTAAEITPVRSVDGIATRCAGPGPVTKAVNAAFRGLFDGSTPDRFGWLEPIATPVPASTVREVEHA